MVQLVATKLQPPPLRCGRVYRPRVHEHLDGRGDGHVVLVSAPPGFGKSTFTVEWLEACGRPYSWYSLDRFDGDRELFGEYLSAAVSRLTGRPSGIRNVLGELAVETRTLIAALLDDVGSAPIGSTLVLDDCHTVDSIEIHEAIGYLVEYLPQHMNLVLITRADPPLPLARLRAAGKLIDVRAEHLRFTPDEVGDFFTQALGLDLSSKEMVALADRSEGWVAALQLVSLGRRPTSGSELVAALSASHRHISTYLIDEVLNRMPPQRSQFLLDTSILDRFDAELCQAIATEPDPANVIDELEAGNAFIIPLTERSGGWYRYHHLFAELLQSRLRRTDAERERVLLVAAAEHCDGRGLPDDAIEYALRGGNLALAAEIADRHAPAQLASGSIGRFRSWLGRFPVPAGPATPVVTLGWAWCRIFEGDVPAAYDLIDQVESAFVGEFPIDIRGQLQVMRAMAAFQGGEPEQAERYARDGLSKLPPGSQYMECLGHLYVGRSLYARSMWDEARVHLQRAANLAERGNLFAAVTALFWLGATDGDTGSLTGTEASMRRAQQLSVANGPDPDNAPAAGIADVGLAYVGLNRLEIDDAIHFAQRGTELLERTTFAEMVFRAYFVLAEALSLGARFDDSQDVVQHGIAWLRGRHMSGGPLEAWLWMSQARNAMRQHDHDEAAQILNRLGTSGLGGSADIETAGFFEAATRLSLEMRRGDVEVSKRLLSALPPRVPGYVPFEIEHHVLTAAMHELLGESRPAVDAMARAIDLAADGYRYQFSHTGPVIRPILERMAGRSRENEFVQSLLDRIPAGRSVATDRPLAELTTRELDVLMEIASGHSNAVIADRLFISHGTVKRHTANIYMKLGVHHRAEAAARGRELGLIS